MTLITRCKMFPPGEEPQNSITIAVLDNPRVDHDCGGETLTIVIRDELLVRRSVLSRYSDLHSQLIKIATHLPGGVLGGDRQGCGCAGRTTVRPVSALAGQPVQTQMRPPQPPSDVEIWRINDPDQEDSIDAARRLRLLVKDDPPPAERPHEEPAISPNHVAILCNKYDSCPATPQQPAEPLVDWIPQPSPGRTQGIVLIDSGYFPGINTGLDKFVTSVPGRWFDTKTGIWTNDPADTLSWAGNGVLSGVAGHGTFNAGLIAHGCPQAAITVIGSRHDITLVPPNPGLDTGLVNTEFDIANAVLDHAGLGVTAIACGFAYPTLDDFMSISFSSVIETIRAGDNPGIAVVAPAGNEYLTSPYYPAAVPTVIGVASCDPTGQFRSSFSNWGTWCDCCSCGEEVVSTYVNNWDGPVEGAPPGNYPFNGWAEWSGTSFAAPKVAAAIASYVATHNVAPNHALAALVSGAPVIDQDDEGNSVTPLPYLDLG